MCLHAPQAAHQPGGLLFDWLQEYLWPHYLPGRWVPHFTLAMEIVSGLAPEVVGLVRERSVPLDVMVESLGIVSYGPARLECEARLGER